MQHSSRPGLDLTQGRIAAIASRAAVGERTAMARYFAFFVVGCAFSLGAVAMAKTHLQVSNPAPQVVAYQSAH
jgi:hypothetical protein